MLTWHLGRGGAWPPCPLPLNPPLPLFTPLIVCVFTASEVTTYGGIEICILLLLLLGLLYYHDLQLRPEVHRVTDP